MAKAARASSPVIPPTKKAKVDSTITVVEQEQPQLKEKANGHDVPPENHVSLFTPNLFDPRNIHRLNNDYHSSEPYKYALVEKLFQDDLLKKVVDECLGELHYTERETDIYKVCFI